jgi:hypothetical protein
MCISLALAIRIDDDQSATRPELKSFNEIIDARLAIGYHKTEPDLFIDAVFLG